MMIRTLRLILTLLVASVAFAAPVQTALTPDGALYAVQSDLDLPLLQLTKRVGSVTTSLLVPQTEDEAVESQARLLVDGTANRLFVLWHRASAEGDEIRLVSLDAEGNWSEPIVVSGCNTAHRAGLQVTLTQLTPSRDAAPVTFVHAAWWKLTANEPVAEYALLAFEQGTLLSRDVQGLVELSGLRQSSHEGEDELVHETLHPPLALARAANADEVEAVFGATNSTSLTRVRLRPRQVAGQARLWTPGRGSGGTLPPARLASTNGAPVRSMLSRGRLVLYTPDEQFRFVILENGQWGPTRMLRLDERLSGDALVNHLRDAIDAQEVQPVEDDGISEE
jgi:hypothetical protein